MQAPDEATRDTIGHFGSKIMIGEARIGCCLKCSNHQPAKALAFSHAILAPPHFTKAKLGDPSFDAPESRFFT
jgi:hypothetical protein